MSMFSAFDQRRPFPGIANVNTRQGIGLNAQGPSPLTQNPNKGWIDTLRTPFEKAMRGAGEFLYSESGAAKIPDPRNWRYANNAGIRFKAQPESPSMEGYLGSFGNQGQLPTPPPTAASPAVSAPAPRPSYPAPAIPEPPAGGDWRFANPGSYQAPRGYSSAVDPTPAPRPPIGLPAPQATPAVQAGPTQPGAMDRFRSWATAERPGVMKSVGELVKTNPGSIRQIPATMGGMARTFAPALAVEAMANPEMALQFARDPMGSVGGAIGGIGHALAGVVTPDSDFRHGLRHLVQHPIDSAARIAAPIGQTILDAGKHMGEIVAPPNRDPIGNLTRGWTRLTDAAFGGNGQPEYPRNAEGEVMRPDRETRLARLAAMPKVGLQGNQGTAPGVAAAQSAGQPAGPGNPGIPPAQSTAPVQSQSAPPAPAMSPQQEEVGRMILDRMRYMPSGMQPHSYLDDQNGWTTQMVDHDDQFARLANAFAVNQQGNSEAAANLARATLYGHQATNERGMDQILKQLSPEQQRALVLTKQGIDPEMSAPHPYDSLQGVKPWVMANKGKEEVDVTKLMQIMDLMGRDPSADSSVSAALAQAILDTGANPQSLYQSYNPSLSERYLRGRDTQSDGTQKFLRSLYPNIKQGQ